MSVSAKQILEMVKLAPLTEAKYKWENHKHQIGINQLFYSTAAPALRKTLSSLDSLLSTSLGKEEKKQIKNAIYVFSGVVDTLEEYALKSGDFAKLTVVDK